MIDKILYWLVTVPARSLALAFGGFAALVLIGAVMMAQAGRGPQPGGPVAQPTPGRTPVAQLTQTTPEPGQPDFGAPVTLNGWSIALQRIERRECMIYKDGAGITQTDAQPYYLVWIDAKNEADAARSLRLSLSWAMRTEGNHIFYARLDQDPETGLTGTWVETEGRDYLGLDVPPGGETHPLLAFRTYNRKPLSLQIQTVEKQPLMQTFDLTGIEPPTSAAGCL